MEDVRRQHTFVGLLFYLYLCGCCIVTSVSLAATQGTAGQTSIGSVAITVHIPRTVRLLANQTSLSTDTQANFCLSVIDANAPSGLNYYRVNASGDSSTKLPENIQSKWLRLNNIYGLPKNSIAACHTSSLQVDSTPVNKGGSNLVVLMLVPE